ncbi:MAG: IS200/IS605 family transposase [Candidatus Latescibacteria bacterium]|nr:IS200/IS605 family transposase [Candidatus Latescibacterota bacterium]
MSDDSKLEGVQGGTDRLLTALTEGGTPFGLLPLFSLDDEDRRRKHTLNYEKQITLDAEQLAFKWQVSADPSYGFPDAFDRKVFKIIEALALRPEKPLRNPVFFSLYQILQVLDLPPFGMHFARVRSSIQRIAALKIHTHFTRAGTDNADLHSETFHVYNDVVFQEEAFGNDIGAGNHQLNLGEWYLEGLNEGFIQPMDLGLLASIPDPVSNRLCEVLQCKFADKGTKRDIGWHVSYSDLCQLLPIKEAGWITNPQRQLDGMHEELIALDVLDRVEWEKSSAGWTLVYIPGQNRTADAGESGKPSLQESELESPEQNLSDDSEDSGDMETPFLSDSTVRSELGNEPHPESDATDVEDDVPLPSEQINIDDPEADAPPQQPLTDQQVTGKDTLDNTDVDDDVESNDQHASQRDDIPDDHSVHDLVTGLEEQDEVKEGDDYAESDAMESPLNEDSTIEPDEESEYSSSEKGTSDPKTSPDVTGGAALAENHLLDSGTGAPDTDSDADIQDTLDTAVPHDAIENSGIEQSSEDNGNCGTEPADVPGLIDDCEKVEAPADEVQPVTELAPQDISAAGDTENPYVNTPTGGSESTPVDQTEEDEAIQGVPQESEIELDRKYQMHQYSEKANFVDPPDTKRTNEVESNEHDTGEPVSIIITESKGAKMLERNGDYSLCDIKFHIAWTTKARDPILTNGVGTRSRELIREICAVHDARIVSGLVAPDHIHIEVACPPTVAPGDLVSDLKERTLQTLMDEFPDLKQQYWGHAIWSVGYLCVTSGGNAEEQLRQYLDAQQSAKDDVFQVTS